MQEELAYEDAPEFYEPIHRPGRCGCFSRGGTLGRLDRLVASGQHWSWRVPLEVASEDLVAQGPRRRQVQPFTDFPDYVNWGGRSKPPKISTFVGYDLTMASLYN
jgi:hypothetical protein